MINKITKYLDELYPNPICELEYSKDYELLLAIVMSAQTTDKRVNMVNKELFKKYDTLSKINNAPTEEIEKIIKQYWLVPTGGSDYHGFYSSVPHPLGTCTMPEEALEALIEVRNELNK